MDFLLGTRLGYCQQFSGAMALLLRMGGVPARVISGFGPGVFDKKRGEYVVRDDDAHSWVEAYFPGIGWQTFDPTPPAAPVRSQLSDIGSRTAARRPNFPTGATGDRPIAPGDPGSRPVADGGVDWTLVGALAAIVVALAAAA